MLRRVIFAIFATLVIAGGYWLFWQSPWLTVKRTSVSIAAPAAGVGKWKDPGLVARVRKVLPDVTGMHLVSVDASQLGRTAESVRGVARVEVRRGWPDAIVVVITPAHPVAYIRQSTSAHFPRVSVAATVTPTASARSVTPAQIRYGLIDAHGTVVDVRRTKPKQWPYLASKPSSVGGQAALRVLLDLPQSLRAKVVEIRSERQTSADTVEFTLRSGRVIVWGSAENSERKTEVLKEMVRFTGKVIDVSAPEVPVTRD